MQVWWWVLGGCSSAGSSSNGGGGSCLYRQGAARLGSRPALSVTSAGFLSVGLLNASVTLPLMDATPLPGQAVQDACHRGHQPAADGGAVRQRAGAGGRAGPARCATHHRCFAWCSGACAHAPACEPRPALWWHSLQVQLAGWAAGWEQLGRWPHGRNYRLLHAAGALLNWPPASIHPQPTPGPHAATSSQCWPCPPRPTTPSLRSSGGSCASMWPRCTTRPSTPWSASAGAACAAPWRSCSRACWNAARWLAAWLRPSPPPCIAELPRGLLRLNCCMTGAPPSPDPPGKLLCSV